MPPLLDVRGLGLTRDGAAIVDDASLALSRGEVGAVTGPSGAGKTTLLRLIVRLEEPTRGTVLLDGRDHRELDPPELRRRVGWVPQEPAFEPGTVWENLTLGPRLAGRELDGDRAEALLARVELAAKRDRDVDELSAGERQRLALARTLVVDPDALLLDEPTANLDRALEGRVEDLLAELAGEDRGVLLVTHAPEQARRLAGKAWRMQDGRLAPDEAILEGAP